MHMLKLCPAYNNFSVTSQYVYLWAYQTKNCVLAYTTKWEEFSSQQKFLEAVSLPALISLPEPFFVLT